MMDHYEVAALMSEDHYHAMALMSERLNLHLDSLEETWRTMLKNEPESAFTMACVEACEEVRRAVYSFSTLNGADYSRGYWYACLVILGIDTTGLGRDDA